MYDLIDSLNKDDGVTVIMISHDISAAVQYARHILHLGSRDVFFGSVEEYRGKSSRHVLYFGCGKIVYIFGEKSKVVLCCLYLNDQGVF